MESRIEDKKEFTESDRGHHRVGFGPLVQQQIYTLLKCYIHMYFAQVKDKAVIYSMMKNAKV